jgi:Protein of unknown function (DUF3352)
MHPLTANPCLQRTRPAPRSARGCTIASVRSRATFSVAALLAGGALLLGGCGSSSPTGTSADPATAVPAAAALYVGATVRPSGVLAKSALAAGRALTHEQNPYLRLLALLETPGSPKLGFARDVAPWLGPRAGVFLSSPSSAGVLPSLLEQGLLGRSSSSAFPFSAGGVQGAIVLDTSDSAKAKAFLESQAAHAGAHATSYRGIRYMATAGGIAFALVHRFAVIGSEAGVRSVIETTGGAAALARTKGYSQLLAAAPTNAIAHFYSNPRSLATPSPSGEGLSGLLLALTGAHPANVSLVPAAGSLALDVDRLGAGANAEAGELLSSDPEAARAFEELPGESWLAIGLGHLGATIGRDAQELEALSTLGSSGAPAPAGGLSLGSLLQGLLTPLRALGSDSSQAKREFASWMGSGGVFASGASLLELKAAAVISSTDAALSRAAVAELGEQLRKQGGTISPVSIPGTEAAVAAGLTGLPVKLDIAAGRDAAGQAKFVLGLAETSVEAALRPPSTLSSAAQRSTAAASLGEGIQPSLLVNFPTLLTLLEGVGLLEAPPVGQFVPYLRATTTLVAGARHLGGEVERFRAVLGL